MFSKGFLEDSITISKNNCIKQKEKPPNKRRIKTQLYVSGIKYKTCGAGNLKNPNTLTTLTTLKNILQ